MNITYTKNTNVECVIDILKSYKEENKTYIDIKTKEKTIMAEFPLLTPKEVNLLVSFADLLIGKNG